MTIVSAASAFTAEVGTRDFASELFAATHQALTKITSIKVTARPPPLSSRGYAERRPLYDQSTANAVLFFTVEYSFVELYGIHDYVHFNGNAAMFPQRRRCQAASPPAQ